MKTRYKISIIVAVIVMSIVAISQIPYLTTLEINQVQESFSEDYFSIPSCYTGVFVNDHVQCSTLDSPPCPEPSFEKNGFCIVEKNEICEKETVLKDGNCIPKQSRDYYDISRQNLQTGETLSDFGMFVSIVIGSFGSVLIVLFIVIYAVKKRMKKSVEEKK